MDKNFGTVTLNGKVYTLTQDAYVDNYGTNGAVRYYASAVDEDGVEYRVTWKTTNEWNLASELYSLEQEMESLNIGEELSEEKQERYDELSEISNSAYVEDGSNACDWDCPISVELI